MENLFLLGVIITIVIVIVFGFAIASNKAEEPPRKQQKKEQKQKLSKKEIKERKAAKEQKIAATIKNQPSAKKGKNDNPKDYDGGDEDDAKMLEFLRGTSDFNAQQAKEARVNKAKNDSQQKKNRAESNKAQHVAAVAVPTEDSADYTVINRKKADDANKKKKADDATAEDSNDAGDRKGNKKKFFLKTDVPAKGEKKVKGDKPPRRRGPVVDIEGEESAENAENNGERKPYRKQQNAGEQQAGEEGALSDSPANGPRNANRPPREPRKPREVQPIPKPLSGTFETPSLDEMLSAFSAQYETKRSGDSAVKETSA